MKPLLTLNQIVYSFDASSLIEAHHIYPREIFPSLWGKLEQLAKSDRLKMAEVVFEEVGDPEIEEWFKEKQLKSYIRVAINEIDQSNAQTLVPKLVDSRTGESGGDPWVIALAQRIPDCVVVTQEKASGSNARPKIPNICKQLGIECINLLDLLRKENWVF